MKSKILMPIALALALVGFTGAASAAPQYWGFFYGNYGGPRWSAGRLAGDPFSKTVKPVDKLDEACKTHDQAYATAKKYWKPKYDAANLTMKPIVWAKWYVDHKNADRKLALSVSALPKLEMYRNGTDSWGGKGFSSGMLDYRTTYRRKIVYAEDHGLFLFPIP